jgi:hypothetical protein
MGDAATHACADPGFAYRVGRSAAAMSSGADVCSWLATRAPIATCAANQSLPAHRQKVPEKACRTLPGLVMPVARTRIRGDPAAGLVASVAAALSESDVAPAAHTLVPHLQLAQTGDPLKGSVDVHIQTPKGFNSAKKRGVPRPLLPEPRIAVQGHRLDRRD